MDEPGHRHAGKGHGEETEGPKSGKWGWKRHLGAVSLDPESRRRPEGLHLGAKSLLLSKVKWGEWRVHREQCGSDRCERQQRQTGKVIGNDIGHTSSMADGEMDLGDEG